MKESKPFSPSLKELVSQEAAKLQAPNPFTLDQHLFKQQLDFVKDPARFKTAVTTRRSGKTESCAADMLYTALEEAELVVVYITLTRLNAKRLIWPALKRLNRKYKLGFTANESELTLSSPNGSIIYLSGINSKDEIEKFRGLSIRKVYLDEAQSFPAYVEELVDEVLGPALMDHAGDLILIGTPGPVPSGYFYDCSRSKTWSHHVWSFFDNHHFPALKKGRTHKDLLDEELERTGLTVESPKIQREWFGRWVLDRNSLVYQYNPDNSHWNVMEAADFTYILGIDIGFHDADALAVLAWSDEHKTTYLVEEIVTPRQGITELVEQIRMLRDKYGVAKMVMDTGGLGKKIAEELASRYQISVEPADKTRKAEYIELMNDDLRTGRLKAKRESRFAQDCYKVEWDYDKSRPDRKVISDRFHSDICDAVLYAWRVSYGYASEIKPKPPKYGTKEWADAETERMEAEALEYFTQQEEAAKNDPFGE